MLALAYRHRAGLAALALVALVAVVWLVTGILKRRRTGAGRIGR